MTKTSTPTPLSNPSRKEVSPMEDFDEQTFYKSLKPKLDQLKKDPSTETIEKILRYSKESSGLKSM